MTSHLDKIKAVTARLRELRAKANPLFWFVDDNEVLVDNDSYATNNGNDCTSQIVKCYDYNKENLPFIAESANKIEALCESLDIALDTLKKISEEQEQICTDTVGIYVTLRTLAAKKADEAIKQIAEKVSRE